MWWADYVGLPFGEGKGEVTCWSLICCVYRDQLGIDLPGYGEISARDLVRVARRMGAEHLAEPWLPVNDPRAHDVVLMRSPRGGSAIVHVGVMVNGAGVLHVEEATASVVVPLNHFGIRHRIAGFRRYVH